MIYKSVAAWCTVASAFFELGRGNAVVLQDEVSSAPTLAPTNYVYVPNNTTSPFYTIEVDSAWETGDSLLGGDYSALQQLTSIGDDEIVPLTLPWKFKYFDSDYKKALLSSNGVVSFGNAASSAASMSDAAAARNSASKSESTAPRKEFTDDDSYIVVLHRHLGQEHLSSLSSSINERHASSQQRGFVARVVKEYKKLKMLSIKSPSPAALEYIKSHASVREVHRERVFSARPIVKEQFSTAYSWGADRLDQAALPLDGAAYVPPAYTAGGADTNVYIMDAGIDTTHAELQAGSRIVQNIYAVDGDLSANNDRFGHGTHAAGLVGGKNIGVAPNANIYGIKILDDNGSGISSSVIGGFEYLLDIRAANPLLPMVASMSFDGYCGTACSNDAVVVAIEELANEHITVVVPAGNARDDACHYTPGFAPQAITVGATTSSDHLASFSNWGSCVDIFAPGSEVLSACSSTGSLTCDSGSTYITLSGTAVASLEYAAIVLLMLRMTLHSYTVAPPDVATISNAVKCSSNKNRINIPDFFQEGTRNLLATIPAFAESFSSVACDTSTCDASNCIHGTCAYGVCACNFGYSGPSCNNEIWTEHPLCCKGESMANVNDAPFRSIAMLWTDLNPSALSGAGSVYHGSVDSSKYAIVFKDVIPYGFTVCTATFELLLHSNGKFELAHVSNQLGVTCELFNDASIGFKGPYQPGSQTAFQQMYGPSTSGLPVSFHVSATPVAKSSNKPAPGKTEPSKPKPTSVPTTSWLTGKPTLKPTAKPTPVSAPKTTAKPKPKSMHL